MKPSKIAAVVIMSVGALTLSAMVEPDASAQTTKGQKAKSADSGTMQRANPEIRRVLEKLEQLGAKPIGTQSVAETRKGPTPADAVRALLKDNGKDPVALMAQLKVKKQDMTYPAGAGTQPIRIYTPEDAGAGPLPVIVYFHGGGWVIADIDTYESSTMALSSKTKAIVVSVEYRKAPENKFPAAHEDSFAAYRWVIENATKFGGDPQRIAVAGESAGGNLAINVAIMARDQKVQAPVHMLLVYPVAGTNMNTASYQKNVNAKPLSKAAMAWFVENTVRSDQDLQNPMLDIVGKANLKGLPPATVITAEIDPLMSEGNALAGKLKQAGVRTTYQNYDGVVHEFFGMDAVVASAGKAQALAANQLRASFNPAQTTGSSRK